MYGSWRKLKGNSRAFIVWRPERVPRDQTSRASREKAVKHCQSASLKSRPQLETSNEQQSRRREEDM